MNENINNNTILEEEESSFDFKKLKALLILNVHWILLSVVACFLVAGIYLWFAPTKVTVEGTMELIDRSQKGKGGSMSIGQSMLNALPMNLGSMTGGGPSNIESEKEILKSNTLLRTVVKDLGLYTEYSVSRLGRKSILYGDQPVSVSLDEAHLKWLDTELPLTFHQIELTIRKGVDGYTVEPVLIEGKQETELPAQTFATLPATLKTDYGTLSLTENTTLTDKQRKAFEGDYTLEVTITPPTTAANVFKGNLLLEPPSKKVTNMLSIKIKDENLMRGLDFVNHLVEAYNQRANDEKNEEARKTDEFINTRLARLDTELGTSDADWEGSKKNFQIIAPEVDAAEVVQKKGVYELQLVELGTQIQLHDYLSEFIHDPANLFEIIPAGVANMGASTSAMGTSSSGAGASSASSAAGASGATAQAYLGLVSQHNELVNKRKDYLRSMSEQSPQIQRLTDMIRDLHPTILQAMKRDRQNLVLRRNNLEREYAKYQGRVSLAPKVERVLTEIGRQREIKQGVYLLMLQKREETAMDLANTTDKGKLIDEPSVSDSQPKKPLVLLVAVFLGLLLPIGILYLLDMFKSTFDTPADLARSSQCPLLGMMTPSEADEAIRGVRTNLLLQLQTGQRVVMVTSDQDGDGKTTLAKQLAESLSAIGKKAEYLDCDLRKSGATSVHPADYFASAAFADKVAHAKAACDYLILDTPSLGKYADAAMIGQQADATLYIVKAESTPKAAVEALDTEAHLPHPMLVFNAVEMSKKKFKFLVK